MSILPPKAAAFRQATFDMESLCKQLREGFSWDEAGLHKFVQAGYIIETQLRATLGYEDPIVQQDVEQPRWAQGAE